MAAAKIGRLAQDQIDEAIEGPNAGRIFIGTEPLGARRVQRLQLRPRTDSDVLMLHAHGLACFSGRLAEIDTRLL